MTVADNEATIQEACQLARDYDKQYGCCPQCVLTAIKETAGFVTDDVIKASHGLSGGGGLTGTGICGALAGGLLALGCWRGRARSDFGKGKFVGNLQACRDLMDRFKKEYAGLTCQDLQERFTGRTYDLWDTGEFTEFKKLRGNSCSEATALVTKWTLEIMLCVGES